MEQVFKYMTGYDNVDDYLKSDKTQIHSKFIQDTEKQIEYGMKQSEKMIKDLNKKLMIH